jgi:hypothetical protein
MIFGEKITVLGKQFKRFQDDLAKKIAPCTHMKGYECHENAPSYWRDR